jgi:hypothetical protein
VCGISWKYLGFGQPKSIKKNMLVTTALLIAIPAAIILFQLIKEYSHFSLESCNYFKNFGSKFEESKGNWPLFFTIMPAV